jgi:hypothetical protein
MACTNTARQRENVLRLDVRRAHEVKPILDYPLRSPKKLAAIRAKPIKIRTCHARDTGLELQYSL